MSEKKKEEPKETVVSEKKKEEPSYIDYDPLEGNPLFQDELEESNQEFFEENDPDFAEFLKQMKGESEEE